MRSHRRVRMFFHRRVELPRLTLRDPRGALMPHGRETETIPPPLGLGNRTPQMPPVYKSQAVAPSNADRPLPVRPPPIKHLPGICVRPNLCVDNLCVDNLCVDPNGRYP